MSLELPNAELLKVMSGAFAPCGNFGICRQAQWSPEKGQIPRGFVGASGSLEDVEVVMIFAEPGHPHSGERHDAKLDANGLLLSGLQHVYQCYKLLERLKNLPFSV